ncbi:hypothetical protein RJ640_003215 [Escallonia rubra]|uniref:Beta-glucosidase n=1 Tax=Escallonia rubra TaxID=112253 RepID=A0AA88RGC9_9ASTE|nr:hypothetical protein RJ640_003215 [Escallonia rubra]
MISSSRSGRRSFDNPTGNDFEKIKVLAVDNPIVHPAVDNPTGNDFEKIKVLGVIEDHSTTEQWAAIRGEVSSAPTPASANSERHEFPDNFIFGAASSAYQEDVGHMRDIGLDAYRFSISWPRIFPSKMSDNNDDAS